MSFDAGTVTAELQLDRKPFIASLREARREAASFAARSYTARLDVDNEGRAEIAEVKAEVESLDGETAEVKVDVDQTSLTRIAGLGGGFRTLASNIKATRIVLATAAIPFAIAAIGASIPTVAALGASFAGLALNLGEAATGFGLVAGAAGGGALGGLVAYTKLLSSTVSDTRAAWEETHKHAAELLEQRRQTILSTHAASLFNEEVNESVIGLSELQAAVGNRVFPGFTSELDAWNKILKVFQPAIVRTAGAVANAVTDFSRWFRTARDGQILADTVAFINSSAVAGANVLADLAKIGILAFQPLIPLASRLQDGIAGIVDETLRWVNSIEGQNKLSQIYNDLFNSAQRLWPVIRDLSIGIVGFFDALDRTGVADQASRGLASLASSFRDATRAGGGLDTFLRNARELMPFVADAAKRVGGAILEIASAAIGAREKGSKLTTLQGIFKAIGDSARPLKNLVVGTFEALGPSIAQLLPQLTRFFSTFAGSSGPLVAFVDVITRALRIFNDLPPGVKRTAAQLAALRLILGGLGITAIVAPLGRFASNMLIAGGAARKLQAPLAAAAGTAAVSGGRFSRLGGAVKAVGLGFLGFVRFAGPVGLILGTIATAAILVWKNWDRIKAAIKPVTDAFGNFIRNVGPPAKELFQTLGRTLRTFVTGLLSAVSPAKTLAGQVKDLVGRFAQFVRDATPKVVAALKSVNHWLKENQPLMRTIGHLVGTVLVGAFKALAGPTRTVIGVIRNVVDVIRTFLDVGRQIGGAIENIIEKIKELIPGFKTSGKNAATAFLEGFKTGGIIGGVVGVLKDAWEAFKNWQQEGSPAKRWEPSGKNAALGWLKGFGDTMKSGQRDIQGAVQGAQGQAGLSIQTAQGMSSGRRTVLAARSADSPGGKSITAGEMRDIMREAHKAQAKNIYAAAVAAGLDPRVLRLLDSIIAKDFNLRTNMLADAR